MARLVQDHGTLKMRQALEPAIRIVVEGFTTCQGAHDSTNSNRGKLGRFPASRDLFLDEQGDGPRTGTGKLFKKSRPHCQNGALALTKFV